VKKIDTYQCFFQMGAMCFDEIEELFRGYIARIPDVQMLVSTRLDARAEFTKKFDNCKAFGEDDFRNLATGSHGLRNNDVIITSGDKNGQTLIVSCCGNYPI
jgi:hypothetical protein